MRRLLLTAALGLAAACARGDGEAEAPAAAEGTDAIASVGEGLAEVGRPAATGPWAVAAAHPLATEAGAAILARGGSAVDAAVAVQAVLTLVEPQSSGLGGGAFMLFFDASTGGVTAYDGRETAPASATPSMFLTEAGTPMPFYDAVTSGRSVGVPGVVAMLALAHERHGRLGWPVLLEDAERLATDGFTVTPRLAGLLERIPRLKETEAARVIFYEEDGTALDAGDTLRNPAYAETLRVLAAEGPASFYTGTVARDIATAVNARAGAGTMTSADLAAYEPIVREPVCADVLTFEVCSMGPPSSGGVTLLQILGLFERTYTPGTDFLLPYVEASRLAYADRDRYLADPAFMGAGGVGADAVVEGLLSPGYLDARAGLISGAPAAEVIAGEPVRPVREGRLAGEGYGLPSTSHFSVRDAYGNVVSMTTSVEFAFGSHLVAGGMILNNQLTDFARDPSEADEPMANAPAPGKRPRSSMTPVIVTEGDRPVVAIGSPGGPAIIGYVAKTLIGRLFLGDDIQAAVERPHLVTARGGVAAETEALAGAARAAGYEEVAVRELTSGLYGFELVYQDGEAARVLPAVDARREGTFETGTITAQREGGL
jgi:gamma-glutamyltranspeptidase/glutathione hydrolase